MDISQKLYLIAGMILYFAPSIVALKLRLKESWNIFFVNVVFGWTVIGWFIAASWAITEIYETADNPLAPREAVWHLARQVWFRVRLRAREFAATVQRFKSARSS